MESGKWVFFLLTALASLIATEAILTYEDEEYGSSTADTYDLSKHPCRRPCDRQSVSLTCYYVFVVERYSSMSKACYNCPNKLSDCFRPHCIPADGKQKSVYVANRQLPGPSIEVCEGDTVVVDVRNNMLAESTTIHWHGVKQKGTPYMDGVPFVTQCPILPGQSFRYTFKADDDGTYFWHSHIGNQRVDGLFGPLLVYPRKTRNLPLYNMYNTDEHCLIITDWSQQSGDAAMIREYQAITGVVPSNILINGLGRQLTNFGNATKTNGPNYVFNVAPNTKNRFRMIDGGGQDCPIEMHIDGHKLIVISLDSNDIQPVEVDAVTIWPGERIDFIVVTNQPVDNYWMRFRGYGQCQDVNNRNNGVYQVATLRYNGAPDKDPTQPIAYNIPANTAKTRVLNPYQRGTEAPKYANVNIPQLTALDQNDAALSEVPDQQVFINFDFYPLDNYDFHRKGLYGFNQVPQNRRIGTLQLNNISLRLKSFPLLSGRFQLKPGDLCNANDIPESCTKEQCACTHVISLRLGAVVELVFVDEGKYAVINHPLHLHGHFFRIVATENLRGNVSIARIRDMDRRGQIKRRLDHAPLKDTMKAPGGGYTIVRFVANNPGYWFFHCHFEEHNNVGMALVFKVGEDLDMPPIPESFPTCGNFVPSIVN